MANSQNHEFIKNRTFEIAWAVFRCASLVKRENLKKELENNAIALVSIHGNFTIDNDLKSEIHHLKPINNLSSIIKLAEAIGEIKIINARVLYRELNNLSNAIKIAIERFEQELIKKENEDIFLEDIFLDNNGTNQQVLKTNKIVQPINLLPNNNPVIVRQSVPQVVRQSPAQGIRQGVMSGIRQSAMADSAVAIKQKADIKPFKKAIITDEDLVQDSWQNLIYRKIKEFGKTSTKEIAAFFPEISERTIRFYLQKLTDAELIEKLGTTGPGSYYIYRK